MDKKEINFARGYYGVVLVNPKVSHNLGTLFRSAWNFGASFIATVGRRFKHQASDTVKAFRHMPLYEYATFTELENNIPYGCQMIGIETTKESKSLHNFVHPERAIYLLGAEDSGLPEEIIKKCQITLTVPSKMCLNVAVVGSIVMYDRQLKQRKD